MKLFISLCILALGAGMLMNTDNTIALADLQTETVSKLVVEDIESLEIDATAYGVFDLETGDLIISHQADEELPIASVTKLFTASKILEEASLENIVKITQEDVATEGRAGKLEVGQKYSVRELLFPLLLESSNDAASALGRQIGDVSVGNYVMSDTSGLSAQNKVTVDELSTEIRNLYLTQKYIFDITTLNQYVGEETEWFNNSPVSDLDGYKGGKHGYTEAANRTLVAVFEEVSLGNRELGYVILGSDDVRSDLLKLRSIVESSVRFE